ncbi:MAG: epoxyqueuosine reductase QueH [Lachnospiraceae bacterium]|nr:epoxyqueuosine reductase QueH [Lachnospiraceae bacterium]
MGNAVNYQRELIDILKKQNEANRTPRILLHACCAPCASSCIEVLDRSADITVFFYNPNITIREEYEHRLNEIKRLVGEMRLIHNVKVEEGEYDPEAFFAMAQGLENEPERGRRCHGCYRMRLERTAEAAVRGGYDYFATTLTLSPLKPADVINEIGIEISNMLRKNSLPDMTATCPDPGTGTMLKAGTTYLPSDFKKNNGYLRSIELSKQYDLYRQNYCGCVFSRKI